MGRSFFTPLTHERSAAETYNMKEFAEDRMRASAAYQIDAHQERRKKELQCKPCFYFLRGGMAGQAAWSWSCAVCGEDELHHNTATPRVCRKCCSDYNLCTICGGDLDSKAIRKQKWPELTNEQINEIRKRAE